MERTEIVSLFKNTPADGTEITVCGWAKNIRDSKNIGLHRPVGRRLLQDPAGRAGSRQAGKLR